MPNLTDLLLLYKIPNQTGVIIFLSFKEFNMASVFDVAKYILDKNGEMTSIRLQEFVYYSQAWCLVWWETPLFDEEIQAWASCPVVPTLYNKYNGQFKLDSSFNFGGDANNLLNYERGTINHVFKYYGDQKTWQLVKLTHSENPWKNARHKIPKGHKCNNVITLSSMAEYYLCLV